MKRNIAPLLFGVLFLLAGFGYIVSLIFNFSFDIFFDGWWTLFIIVPAFVSILSNGPRSFNIGALFIGVLFLLTQLDIIDSRYLGSLIIAILIIVAGIALISRFFYKPVPNIAGNYNININTGSSETTYEQHTGSSTGGQQAQGGGSGAYDQQSYPNYNAILSGINERNCSTDLQGARTSAILGGVEIDFRGAIITRDITIFATAVLGGIDIMAPLNVRINVNKTDILGGTTCTAISQAPDANVPIVTFVTTAILGGVEIK